MLGELLDSVLDLFIDHSCATFHRSIFLLFERHSSFVLLRPTSVVSSVDATFARLEEEFITLAWRLCPEVETLRGPLLESERFSLNLLPRADFPCFSKFLL